MHFPVTTIDKIRSKIKHGILLQAFQHRLSKIGIKIVPYYLMQEQLTPELERKFETSYEKFEVGFLSPDEMKIINENRDWDIPEEAYIWQRGQGRGCFGVKLNGEMVSFTLVNFNECDSEVERFSLKENEAYLYDTFTFQPHRGKRIASFMTYQCYKALHQMGINTFYTLTDVLNTPAIKFRRSLGAKLLRLGIFIDILGRHKWTFKLKEYR